MTTKFSDLDLAVLAAVAAGHCTPRGIAESIRGPGSSSDLGGKPSEAVLKVLDVLSGAGLVRKSPHDSFWRTTAAGDRQSGQGKGFAWAVGETEKDAAVPLPKVTAAFCFSFPTQRQRHAIVLRAAAALETWLDGHLEFADDGVAVRASVGFGAAKPFRVEVALLDALGKGEAAVDALVAGLHGVLAAMPE